MASVEDQLNEFRETMDRIFDETKTRLEPITAGVCDDNFEVLRDLSDFGEYSNFCHSECPRTAEEIRDVENRVKSKKDSTEQLILQAQNELEELVTNANEMGAADEWVDQLNTARQIPLDAVSEMTALLGSCVDDMQDSIKDKTSAEQAQLLSAEYESRANIRRSETLNAVRQCLEESEYWPYNLEEIYDKKDQVDLVIIYDEEGKADGQQIGTIMQVLDDHIADLEKKQKKAKKEYGNAQEALGGRYKRMKKMWLDLEEQIKAYLTESTKTAGLSILEDRLDTAIIDAKEAKKSAVQAKQDAKPAAESLGMQARKGAKQIHSMVKESAQGLQPSAEAPAQVNMENKEICRLLAEKVQQEAEFQMRRVEQELCIAEAAKKKLEGVPSASLQNQIKLAQLRTKVEQLQSSQQELSTSLTEANSLQKVAGEQMKNLKELESVGYAFGMDLRVQNAKEGVDRVWTDLPQDEPETDNVSHVNVSHTAVNGGPETGALAQIEKNDLQKQIEELRQMVLIEKGRRQNVEDQMQAMQMQQHGQRT